MSQRRQKNEEKFDKEFVENASYVERAISYYFKEKMFEGLQTLTDRRFIGFFIYLLLILFGAIGAVIASVPQIGLLDIVLAKKFVMLGITTAFVFVVGGLISSLLGNTGKNLIIILLCGLSVYYVFFIEYDYDWIFWQFVKVGFFIIWASISATSGFSMVVSFFTSLPGRIVTIGKSKSHLFMGWILKLLVLACIPAFIYMFLGDTIDMKIVGAFGAFVSLIVLIKLYTLPNKETDEHDGGTNYAQILGFFYFLIIAQLVSSFGSSTATFDLLKELALLCVLGLFMINSITTKVKRIKSEEELKQEKMKFVERSTFLTRVRERAGDKSLIFITLGIALGYIMFTLDSYLGSPIFLLDPLLTPTVTASTIYHRFYILIGLMIVLISIVRYSTSTKFQGYVRNRYTFKDTWYLFKGLFTKGLDGEDSVVQQEIKAGADKIKEKLSNAKDSFLSGFVGKKPKGSDNSEIRLKQIGKKEQ